MNLLRQLVSTRISGFLSCSTRSLCSDDCLFSKQKNGNASSYFGRCVCTESSSCRSARTEISRCLFVCSSVYQKTRAAFHFPACVYIRKPLKRAIIKHTLLGNPSSLATPAFQWRVRELNLSLLLFSGVLFRSRGTALNAFFERTQPNKEKRKINKKRNELFKRGVVTPFGTGSRCSRDIPAR